MSVTTITQPVSNAVTVSEAREQVVAIGSDHDVLLTRLIAASERMAEQYLGGFISERTVEVTMDAFPVDNTFKLPVFPIQSVVSVTYTDTEGGSQTLTEGTDFRASLNGKAGHLVALNGWPTSREYSPDSVKVRLVVGYASGEAPEDVRHAILLKVSELFENRNESIVGSSIAPSMNTFHTLLNTHRRYGL